MLARMGASDQRRRGRSRRHALAILALAALPAGTALAAASKPVVLSDPKGDVGGPLDVRRAALSLPRDGRLRFVVSFASRVTPKALRATSGPPGSVCVRVWTDAEADPAATRPDRLVCVTSDKNGTLRAGVLEQRDAGLPRRVATATVAASASRRSLVVRVAQSALQRPALIRFGVESTRPGCTRTSCVDRVPDGGAVRRFRLR